MNIDNEKPEIYLCLLAYAYAAKDSLLTFAKYKKSGQLYGLHGIPFEQAWEREQQIFNVLANILTFKKELKNERLLQHTK